MDFIPSLCPCILVIAKVSPDKLAVVVVLYRLYCMVKRPFVQRYTRSNYGLGLQFASVKSKHNLKYLYKTVTLLVYVLFI